MKLEHVWFEEGDLYVKIKDGELVVTVVNKIDCRLELIDGRMVRKADGRWEVVEGHDILFLQVKEFCKRHANALNLLGYMPFEDYDAIMKLFSQE
jgi:hypothetical protein